MADNEANPPTQASRETIDLTNPLYMHPSENAGAMLLPGVFDGTGYR